MRGLTDRGTPAKHKMSQANNVPRLVLGDLRINASASSSPRARHTPPQKARLPAVYGRPAPAIVEDRSAGINRRRDSRWTVVPLVTALALLNQLYGWWV